MPFDDEVALERQVAHFKGQIRSGRPDAEIAKEIVLDVVGGCSCVSLFGSDRCRACRAYYLLMGFVTAARADGETPTLFIDEDVEGAEPPLFDEPDPKEKNPLACRPCGGTGNMVGGSSDPNVMGAWLEQCRACYGTGREPCVKHGCLKASVVVEPSEDCPGNYLCEDHRSDQ